MPPGSLNYGDGDVKMSSLVLLEVFIWLAFEFMKIEMN